MLQYKFTFVLALAAPVFCQQSLYVNSQSLDDPLIAEAFQQLANLGISIPESIGIDLKPTTHSYDTKKKPAKSILKKAGKKSKKSPKKRVHFEDDASEAESSSTLPVVQYNAANGNAVAIYRDERGHFRVVPTDAEGNRQAVIVYETQNEAEDYAVSLLSSPPKKGKSSFAAGEEKEPSVKEDTKDQSSSKKETKASSETAKHKKTKKNALEGVSLDMVAERLGKMAKDAKKTSEEKEKNANEKKKLKEQPNEEQTSQVGPKEETVDATATETKESQPTTVDQPQMTNEPQVTQNTQEQATEASASPTEVATEATATPSPTSAALSLGNSGILTLASTIIAAFILL